MPRVPDSRQVPVGGPLIVTSIGCDGQLGANLVGDTFQDSPAKKKFFQDPDRSTSSTATLESRFPPLRLRGPE